MKTSKSPYFEDSRIGRVPLDKFGDFPKRYYRKRQLASVGVISPDVIRDREILGDSLIEEVTSELSAFFGKDFEVDDFPDLKYLSEFQFSEDWMVPFLYAFIFLGSITLATKAVSISNFKLIHSLKKDEVFRSFYEDAKLIVADRVLSEAFMRAVHGIKEYYFRDGKLVRDEKGRPLLISRYNDDLLKFLLKGLVPAFRDKVDVSMSADITVKEVDGIDAYRERLST